MINAVLFSKQHGTTRTGGEELIQVWRDEADSIIWLDICEAEAAAEEKLLMSFGIHRLAIQDAMRSRHPPKIEAFDDYVFILMRGLDASTQGIEFSTIQLSLFVSDRYLITRHKKPAISTDWLASELAANADLSHHNPSELVLMLSNKLVRRYVEILLELEPRLDHLEDSMFETNDDSILSELTGYKSRLRHLARIANYHLHIATELQKYDLALFPQKLKHEIVDLYEQIERSRSLAALYYEVATDLTDGYLALASHRLNSVMKVLTIITVIFVPMTFLAGIYGMNFSKMPELATENGYFVVLGVMFVAAVVQLIVFKRRGWL